MDFDLTGLTVDQLIVLRGRVAAEVNRQTILTDTPEEVAALASRYASVGGDPAVLRAALNTEEDTL